MIKMDSILEIKDLSIGYTQQAPLCEHIEFSLKKGEILALMGVNGSGKSTFLKTLMGLIPEQKGEILIQGKTLNSFSKAQLAQRMAVVLTDRVWVKDMEVAELIAYGRYPHTSWLGSLKEEDKRIIQKSIEKVGLLGFEKRKLGTLSDGEAQRVMLARGLAQETELLILDEPTSHLDIPNKILMMQLLQKLAHEHDKTIIYSTHELDFARKAADRVFLFTSNKTYYLGDPNSAESEHFFIKQFGDLSLSRNDS